ncbi:MAG TPA: hypothetical protein VFE33_04385 [Thermoanaerobaculia bacterium]|nr:hypothetical protein [Thermoanaerobaculia bacterium]
MKKSLKLKLHRETLRALDPPALADIAGGATAFTCNQLTCPFSDCHHTCVNGSCTC